ncbi:MAG: PTS sugar transporter subunit IIA [Desulfobacterales bacterium]|nr:PTS sugar transporter subunit IIA [Desulfobacterales bacterium]
MADGNWWLAGERPGLRRNRLAQNRNPADDGRGGSPWTEPKGSRKRINRGGLYYNLGGDDPVAVLRSIVQTASLPAGLDRESLLLAVLERETLMPTALGDGIAIPHPRSPLLSREEDERVARLLSAPPDTLRGPGPQTGLRPFPDPLGGHPKPSVHPVRAFVPLPAHGFPGSSGGQAIPGGAGRMGGPGGGVVEAGLRRDPGDGEALRPPGPGSRVRTPCPGKP